MVKKVLKLLRVGSCVGISMKYFMLADNGEFYHFSFNEDSYTKLPHMKILGLGNLAN